MTAGLKMRAFVTGGSGFIGSHLIDALLEDNWRVGAVLHRAPILQADRVDVYPGDVTDFGAVEAGMKDADVVFHLASAVGSSLAGRDEYFRINAAGTEAVLKAARRARVARIIHFGSAGIFGAVRGVDIAGEDYPPRPILAYDHAKYEGEEIARRFAAGGMDVVIVRPGWAYGPRDRRTFKLIRRIARGRFIMATKGAARQSPVYIDDLVSGIRLAAARGKAGETYHLAGGEVLTAREIVQAVASACGRRVPRFHLPSLPARLAAYLLEKACLPLHKEPPLSRPKLSFFLYSKPISIDKSRRELGYSPQVDFSRGIRLALDWYRRNGWL
jgi:nucleoside-diphosphate-sugar epimerase